MKMSYLSENLRCFALVLTLVLPTIALAESSGRDFLSEVANLYGITEEQASIRLAREEIAADAYSMVMASPPRGYAGAWFDSASGTLAVAVDDSFVAYEVERLADQGIKVVEVRNSLSELERVRNAISLLRVEDPGVRSSVVSLSIDLIANSVSVQALVGNENVVRSTLLDRGIETDLVRFYEVESFPQLSSNIRAGDVQENVNFGGSPCTIGASIVGGYITAGHCGYAGHTIENSSGTQIGTVQASQWAPGTLDTFDGAWVSAASGWIPRPKINGYTDGELTVSAKWSGYQVAPLNSTVCRYGGATGGPDCGTIDDFDQDVSFVVGILPGGVLITRIVKDLTKAVGICSDGGDSGGPFVFNNSQIQGTNSGGFPCADPRQEVWFQPISDTLDFYSKSLLTPHGAQKADANGFSCPDFFNSGSNVFYCKFDSYDSQGDTTWLWTSNSASSSSGTFITSNCAPTTWVTVNLAITNPYGTENYSSGFLCPSGPTP